MQELRLVAVSEDGTYLVLATAGRGTRFTLPVDERLRAAVRGNFSRLGQYEIEVESPLRPKEIQARIRAGETAEEIAATAGIPVERVRWFEGPVLQEREYTAQQAQRVAVRLPGESTPGPTLGELVTERLSRRGVPSDEIDWDSCKRDDGLWRIKLGFVWNGHTRSAEWLFDLRRRHVTPYDDEAMRLSAAEYVEPAENGTVTPFVPRLAAKLAPVPTIPVEAPTSLPGVARHDHAARSHPDPVRPDLPDLRDLPDRDRPEPAEPAAFRQEPATHREPAAFRQEPATHREPFREEPAPLRATEPSPAARPAAEPVPGPVARPATERAPRPTFEPAVQQSFERHPQPTFEPAAHRSPEPAAHRSSEPATQHSAEPSAQHSSEPAVHRSSEPAAEHFSASTAHHSPEPAAQHAAEPAAH
ncbi:septation protein SepH, partial [Sphaerisporangium sp. NPDC088356]|uniref:septation protein SepH n=1 Tax=Sphaerisporangium sp. NPDC088356 TaxID=3154871 RepID=UPI003422CF93